jgi:hypothetical protein
VVEIKPILYQPAIFEAATVALKQWPACSNRCHSGHPGAVMNATMPKPFPHLPFPVIKDYELPRNNEGQNGGEF